MTEQLVNTYTTNYQWLPEVTGLVDGGWLVAWQSQNQPGDTGAGIRMQRYAADGSAVGNETQVNSVTEGDQGNQTIAPLPGGGWVVVWNTPGISGYGSEIYLQRFDEAGKAAGAYTHVNTFTDNNQYANSVTTLTDGSFVVTWESSGQDDPNDKNSVGIYQRHFSTAWVPDATIIGVNSHTEGSQGTSATAALVDGGWISTWQSNGQDGDGNGIYGQRFDATGNPVGIEFQVNSITANNQNNPSVIGLASGGWVVVWDNFAEVSQQIFDKNGKAVGGETQVNTWTTNYQGMANIIASADGGWLISWTSNRHDFDDGGNGDNGGIYQQRYDASGQKIGGETRVNLVVEGDQFGSRASVLNDGGYAVTWSGDDKDYYGVFQRRFGVDITGSTADDKLNGTAKDEWLIGRDGKDVLDGEGGDDIMAGGRGDDTYYCNTKDDQASELKGEGFDTISASTSYSLEKVDNIEKLVLSTTAGVASLTGSAAGDRLVGNASANTLNGLAGSDFLDGGAGADKLIGGAGNDTYVIDNAKDVIQEQIGPGQGTDTVRSPFDYSIAANLALENITLTGKAVKATGNSLANVLTGNGLANVLQGGSGADTMKGGAGNDRYYVDNTKDIVTEAKASGSDTVYSKIGWTLGANLEKLILQGSSDLNGKGNALGNTLTGTTGKNTLNGLGGNDTLNGGGGADHLFGRADKDVLNGGAGNDFLSGGGAADRFVFSGKFGHDTIGDFRTGQDHIDVRSIAAVKNFDYLHDHMQEKNGDVIIKLGANWITLENHHIKDFDAHDFMI